MRKIKRKPVKNLKFKPDNVEFVPCYPIEAILFNQRQAEQYEKQRAWGRLISRLRGEPVEPEPDYLGATS